MARFSLRAHQNFSSSSSAGFSNLTLDGSVGGTSSTLESLPSKLTKNLHAGSTPPTTK
eukprot:CAMPEP_0113701288 /NCGR_PEP_ID=MMETSP0038_2-20120614/24478_1 /TAXON_ID=2898 /ORGANISM="Cryptomonas paramecium" /LENGTH=57 /DNA_ID=CAMNT_0000625137 /DNA_START=288 /DNA_END=461 /DNA_ORIENTATION=+ /assembly_acc=CAM_ASM_000170